MNINELSEEVKAKLRECKSAEELRALAEKEGIELTDELLEAVSGGWDFPDKGCTMWSINCVGLN